MSREVFVAARHSRVAAAPLQDHPRLSLADTDFCDRDIRVTRDAFEPSRRPWPSGEEQLVVIAAGDCGGHWIPTVCREPSARARINRQRVAVDDDADRARCG